MFQRPGRSPDRRARPSVIGADTAASATGRTAYGATSVLLTAFWVKSSRARPPRDDLAHSQLTSLGTVAPTARDSASTQPLVSR